MEQERTRLDPHAADPGRWGHSMQNLGELVLGLLDAVDARSVMEVGAYAGDLTGVLVAWAEPRGAKVVAIDPFPQPGLAALAEEHANLELVRETSLAALPRLAPADAIVIDGDHNWHTVTEELDLVARASGEAMPLVLLHDVCWPHGRRDDYYDAGLVPADRRQPIHEGGGLHPDEPGIRSGGLPYRGAAAREGGPRNGVLTAAEDFVDTRDDLRLAVVPAFFGLGVVWRAGAPWAGAVEELLAPWDRNPLLARLEANRVFHLAESHARLVDHHFASVRLAQQEQLLRRLLESRAFGLAERLSRVRHRVRLGPEHAIIEKDEIRRVLGE